MPPQNQSVPPGAAFHSHAAAGHSVRLFIILIVGLAIVTGLGWYIFSGMSPRGDTVTFYAAHGAATYHVANGHFSLATSDIQSVGPVTAADGTPYFSALGDPPLAPITIAPPLPEWMFYRGRDASSAKLGSGRPLGAMADGTLLAITDKGLEALVPGGDVVIMTASPDLVGAVNQDGTLVALRNPVSRNTDIYAIAPQSFQKMYVGSVTSDPLALAFDTNGTLYVVTADNVVAAYTVSAHAAPALVGSTTLPNNWP
ncbi:MAG TPA: hypothetical protein VHC20_01735 [Candidatus Paceibacterota bacterium]|nr:hypothetical protein [Candidatus Paceibacterota bacterium]